MRIDIKPFANLEGVNLKGTNIITFQANRHFAFYHEGMVKIGCISKSLKEWLEKYEQIGKENNYSDQEIQDYGNWLKRRLR